MYTESNAIYRFILVYIVLNLNVSSLLTWLIKISLLFNVKWILVLESALGLNTVKTLLNWLSYEDDFYEFPCIVLHIIIIFKWKNLKMFARMTGKFHFTQNFRWFARNVLLSMNYVWWIGKTSIQAWQCITITHSCPRKTCPMGNIV